MWRGRQLLARLPRHGHIHALSSWDSLSLGSPQKGVDAKCEC
jgi:hypothetical protein